jgi:hypothetical protein
MRICPDCTLELPDGIPTCPDCGVGMIDPDEEPDEVEFEVSGHRYVMLRELPTRLWATMLKEALQNEGIPSILQSEDVGIMLGNFGTSPLWPVRVLVPACFFNRAQRIAKRISGPS